MAKSEFIYVAPFSTSFRFGIGGVIGVAGMAGLVIFSVAAATEDSKAGPIAGIVIAVLLMLIGMYFVSVKVYVRADESTVSLGLTPWPKSTFNWDDVERVEKVDIGFFSAMGIGYRITGLKSRVVLASPGLGLRFLLKDGRSLSVVCDESRDELASLAESHS